MSVPAPTGKERHPPEPPPEREQHQHTATTLIEKLATAALIACPKLQTLEEGRLAAAAVLLALKGEISAGHLDGLIDQIINDHIGDRAGGRKGK